jgi:hypothetical protein
LPVFPLVLLKNLVSIVWILFLANFPYFKKVKGGLLDRFSVSVFVHVFVYYPKFFLCMQSVS